MQRSLNDCEASPCQAAVLFEELMDCYRAQLADFSDRDDQLGIPRSLVPHAIQAGEEHIVANACTTFVHESQVLVWPPAGQIGQRAQRLLVLDRDYHGRSFEGADLSASQIESYLECPYQWFAKRRLRTEGFEESFGVMERGTFVHNVLCAFYQAFQEQVAPKITAENLSRAQTLFDSVFEEQLAYDRTREPGRRYVPTTPWEEQAMAELHRKLRESLVREAALLPRFRPLHMEWDFGQQTPFSFAGCNLTGTIDRIDVDDAGHALVIDYKTGNLDDYSLLASVDQEDFALPHKVQTLIYAQVVSAVLGLNVVGALYYNPFTGIVRGAFDSRTIGPADLLDMKPASAARNRLPACGIEHFDELLSRCEQEIALRIKDLLAGQIEPAPSTAKVCDFCPVSVCDKRSIKGAKA